MPKKKAPRRRPSTEIDWEVFLESPQAVDGLIEFIEGNYNNRQLWRECPTDACRTAVDRMRILTNVESRKQARRFLRQYYTW